MRTLQSILMMLILGMVFVISVWTQPVLADEHDNQTDDKVWSFEKDEIGSIPKGWKVAETRGNEKTATWQVISDGAKSQKAVAITETENKGNTYNLLIAEEIHCKDLEVSVKVKALTGKIDQGGGPIWRAKDANNYYIARWNPLENNFRVYFVKDGRRKQLASADIKTDSTKWHEIEIEHIGSKIVAEFDDKQVIEIEDSTFTEGGMAGLWTKADAATAFDDFEVENEEHDDLEKDEVVWTFDDDKIGSVPENWEIAETAGMSKTATWEIIQDDTVPSKDKAVAVTKTENYGQTFNLLIAKNTNYKDLEVSVMVKAMTGEEDQGGGPIWRAKDANNYYIARWNPLENNFRVYFVKDGRRKQLASAKTNLDPKKWHEIEIEHVGNKIVAELDDQKVIEVEDSTFTEGGMVGLWTKADAATAFDVFEIETENDDDSDK